MRPFVEANSNSGSGKSIPTSFFYERIDAKWDGIAKILITYNAVSLKYVAKILYLCTH